MLEEDVPFRITVARRILAREGCESAVGGHVSVRVPGEDAFWVTPLEYFDETLPERVIKSSMDLELMEGDGEPSPAVAFHASF
jgi:L-fuculose-phosphate aldolase